MIAPTGMGTPGSSTGTNHGSRREAVYYLENNHPQQLLSARVEERSGRAPRIAAIL